MENLKKIKKVEKRLSEIKNCLEKILLEAIKVYDCEKGREVEMIEGFINDIKIDLVHDFRYKFSQSHPIMKKEEIKIKWIEPALGDTDYIIQCHYPQCENEIIGCDIGYIIDVARKQGWKVDEESGYIFCPKCIPKIEKRKTEIKKREEEIIKGNEELERRFKQLEKGIKNEK